MRQEITEHEIMEQERMNEIERMNEQIIRICDMPDFIDENEKFEFESIGFNTSKQREKELMEEILNDLENDDSQCYCKLMEAVLLKLCCCEDVSKCSCVKFCYCCLPFEMR